MMMDTDQVKLRRLSEKESLTAIEQQQKEALLEKLKDQTNDLGKMVVDNMFID